MKPRRPYNLGFHAVDLDLIRFELVPWLLGREGPLPRVAEMGWALHIRHLANAWGLSLFERFDQQRQDLFQQSEPKSFAKLLKSAFGESPAPDLSSIDLTEEFGTFDPALHLFGRPYFITDKGVESVSERVDQYARAASDEEVIELVRGQLDQIAPGQRPHLVPDTGTYHPDYAETIAAEMLTPMREILVRREPYAETPPRHDRRLDQILTALLATASHLGARWMARGDGPSMWLEQTNITFLDMEDAFCMVEDLFPVMPRLKWEIEQTLVHRMDIGAVIQPEVVPTFRHCLLKHRSALLQRTDAITLQKLDECLAHAERKQWGFVESAGILNERKRVLA